MDSKRAVFSAVECCQGKRQKAKGTRHKAKGKRQKAKGKRQIGSMIPDTNYYNRTRNIIPWSAWQDLARAPSTLAVSLSTEH